MVRWCWVNFQCRGVLLIWIIVGQGPTALVVGAGGGCLDIFSLICHFSFLSPSLWETARYRLKYCLKGPLSQKQPTNQPSFKIIGFINMFHFHKVDRGLNVKIHSAQRTSLMVILKGAWLVFMLHFFTIFRWSAMDFLSESKGCSHSQVNYQIVKGVEGQG